MGPCWTASSRAIGWRPHGDLNPAGTARCNSWSQSDGVARRIALGARKRPRTATIPQFARPWALPAHTALLRLAARRGFAPRDAGHGQLYFGEGARLCRVEAHASDRTPFLAVDDVISFLPPLDPILLVVASGERTVSDIANSERLIGAAHMMGIVLNKAEQSGEGSYSY